MTPYGSASVREVLRPYFWPLIILISTLAAVAPVALSPSIQTMIQFWFLLVCPGMAFVRLLRLEEPFLEWTVAVALSIALGVGVAQTLLIIGHWSPAIGLATLAFLALLGAAIQIIHVAWLARDANCHYQGE